MLEKKLKWPRTYPELDKLDFPAGSGDRKAFLSEFMERRFGSVVAGETSRLPAMEAAKRIAKWFWEGIRRWASRPALVHVVSGIHRRGKRTPQNQRILEEADTQIAFLLEAGIMVVRNTYGKEEIGFAHPELFHHILADLHLDLIESGRLDLLRGRYPYQRLVDHLHSAVAALPANAIIHLAGRISVGLGQPLEGFAKSLLFALWSHDHRCGALLLERPAMMDLKGMQLWNLRWGGRPETPLDMSGVDLGEARLVNCVITHVKLHGSSLRGASLDYCWLSHVSLAEVDLSLARLVCCLQQVNGRRVNLDGVKLRTYGPCGAVEVHFLGMPDPEGWSPCKGFLPEMPTTWSPSI